MKTESVALRESKKCIGIIGATLIYCVGLNLFLVPQNIYCGGLFGFCQVLRTIIVEKLGIDPGFDIAALLHYLFNIPILIYAWCKISRGYILKTILCLSVMTPVLALLPIKALLPDDRLASCLIGGILTGAGVGFYMRMGASGGGMDIIGVILVKSNKGRSIGHITLIVNTALYLCCVFLFSIDVVIYSIIYSAVFALVLDRVYIQNINEEVKIITSLPGQEMGRAIISELGRGVTIINSTGAYTNSQSRILYVVLSKYEIPFLRSIVKRLDPHAFIVESGSVNVYGNYLKKLN